MNPEEQNFFEQQEREQRLQQSQFEENQMKLSQSAKELEQQNVGVIKEQLDLTDDLKRIEHLLRGETEVVNKDGEKIWEKPEDNSEILLTEEGIRLVMRTISLYLNKNTLLSNYDEETINHKMEDFATSLADYLFMNYEKYFLFPSPEECNEELIKRLERKQQQQIYNKTLKNEEVNKDEIWNKLVSEIDPQRERINIREQLMKNKLKGYDWLMRVIQDSVHSAYLRALNGMERRTLRQNIHVSEQVGNVSQMQGQGGGGILSWFKRK